MDDIGTNGIVADGEQRYLKALKEEYESKRAELAKRLRDPELAHADREELEWRISELETAYWTDRKNARHGLF